MSRQIFSARAVLLPVLVLLTCLIPRASHAQDVTTLQFLYRDGDRLIVVEVSTRDDARLPTASALTLPLSLTGSERVEWSPDGRYLLALMNDPAHEYRRCLNLYEFDQQRWLYDEPIACAVINAAFSADGEEIAYISNLGEGNVISVFRLEDRQHREIYRNNWTYRGTIGLFEVTWSSSRRYVVARIGILSLGQIGISLLIINTETGDNINISVSDHASGGYQPVWGPEDRWMLITLKGNYMSYRRESISPQMGDIYLVSPESGVQYRLTFTPMSPEYNVRWTDDGRIAFDEVSQRMLTLEQAINVPQISPETTYQEEQDQWRQYVEQQGALMSLDPSICAWTVPLASQSDSVMMQVNVNIGTIDMFLSGPGWIPLYTRTATVDRFSPDYIVGWRPRESR